MAEPSTGSMPWLPELLAATDRRLEEMLGQRMRAPALADLDRRAREAGRTRAEQYRLEVDEWVRRG